MLQSTGLPSPAWPLRVAEQLISPYPAGQLPPSVRLPQKTPQKNGSCRDMGKDIQKARKRQFSINTTNTQLYMKFLYRITLSKYSSFRWNLHAALLIQPALKGEVAWREGKRRRIWLFCLNLRSEADPATAGIIECLHGTASAGH